MRKPDPMKEAAVALSVEETYIYHRLTTHYYEDGEQQDVTACDHRVDVVRDKVGTREELESDGMTACRDCYGDDR